MCKVSVLMPVYNAEKYLAEAIDSIISQTFEDWELVVINDGSTDSSLTIIQQYTDKRIRLIENETNIGLIKTLNKGIKLCKGKYIARMDADDISNPQRFQKQFDFLEKHPQYILCGSNAEVIDNDGRITGRIMNPSQNIYLQISLLFTNPFIHPSVMICKDALEKHQFDAAALHVEDYELWTRLALEGKLANLMQPLLQYRWHTTNVSVKHTDIQESAKNEIIRKQLVRLKINATEEQLRIHRATFQLYALGQKNDIESLNIFDAVSEWFSTLVEQNDKWKVYPTNHFNAFLWSRWMVLAISHRQFAKVLLPRFIPLTPCTIYNTIKLVNYLRRK